MVSQCFQALKLYGKEPEQLDGTLSMFQLVLGKYEFDEIQEAFEFYLSNNTEMPTPADIVSIIRRGNKPPFNQAVYIALSKKGYDARSFEEDKYMRDYEDFLMNG